MTKEEKLSELKKTIDKQRAEALKGGPQGISLYYAYMCGVFSVYVREYFGKEIDYGFKYRIKDDGSLECYF